MKLAPHMMLAAAILLGLAADSSAQCAMCRTALEQDGGQLALGFNRAILFLLVMPYVVFASIAGTWYWKRRKAGSPSQSFGEPRRSPWAEAGGGLDGSAPTK